MILDLAKTATEVSDPDDADFSAGFPSGSRMSAGDINLAFLAWDEPRVRFAAGQAFANWTRFTSVDEDYITDFLDSLASVTENYTFYTRKMLDIGAEGAILATIDHWDLSVSLGSNITSDWTSKMIPGKLFDGLYMYPWAVGTVEQMALSEVELDVSPYPNLLDTFIGVKMPMPVKGSLGHLYLKYDAAGVDGYYFFTAISVADSSEQKLAFLCATDSELLDGSFAHVRNLGMYFGLWNGSAATLAFSSRGYRVGFTETPWLGRPRLQPFRDKVLAFVKTSDPVGYNAFDLIEITNRDPSTWRVIRSFWQSTADSPLHTCEMVRTDRDDLCCVINNGVLYWTVDLENWNSMRLYSTVKQYTSKIAGGRMYLVPVGDGSLTDFNLWTSGVVGGLT